MVNEYCISPPKLTSIEGDGPTLVTYQSPYHHRFAVEQCARHFRREMHYDFCQFNAMRKPGDKKFIEYEAYLFHRTKDQLLFEFSPTKAVISGACCFYKESSWYLDWVWFHPYFRRVGFLSQAWPYFISRYGNFKVTKPLSSHMESFIAKHHA